MRFLVAGGAPQAGAGQWGGHSWHAAWQLNDYIVQRAGDALPQMNMQKVDALLEAVAEFDGVLCESRLALVLAYEWAKRGLAPRPTLALQVHSLAPVEAIRAWYQQTLSVDPWPAMTAAPWIAWLAPTSRQRDCLLEAGFASDRVHRLRISASIFALLMTDAEAQLARRGPREGKGALPEGAVLFAGNGRRDWAAVLRTTLALADLPCAIVGGDRRNLEHHLRAWNREWPANLTHVKSVPFAEFVDAVRTARVVVVPILEGDGDGGHTTVALANRMGVPVVCTDSPTLAEYGVAEQTCLMAQPGDGAGLAAAIRRAWPDGPLRDALCREGERFERAQDAHFHSDLQAAITQACGG